MTVALIASVPTRAETLQTLLDQLSRQTRKIDAVLLSLDGDWPGIPNLRSKVPLVPVLHGEWRGAGARFLHPELARLSACEPVLVVDDDLYPSENYVALSLAAHERTGGMVSWHGFTYDGTRVQFDDDPSIDTQVSYFSIGTMLAHAGVIRSWASRDGASPFFGKGGYDQIYVSMCAWKDGVSCFRPAGKRPFKWMGSGTDASWKRFGPIWRGQRRAISDATGFSPNIAAAHAGLPVDPSREHTAYREAMQALGWPDSGILRAPSATDTPVRLNLGCCDQPMKEWLNCDIVPGTGVDVVADLTQRWPWAESSVDEIRAWDFIEHLPNKIFTMNEAWRVLKPGGVIKILVPTTDGRGAFQDPTHVSFWNRNSFFYYEINHPCHKRFARAYGITAKFQTVHEKEKNAPDAVVHLEIHLKAVK